MKIIPITLTLITLSLILILQNRDASLWVFNTTIKLTSQYTVISNVAYGEQDWQTLDIYPAPNNKAAPVLIFIHGGGWEHGRKEQYRFAADAFLRLGYTVVLPDYIKYPAPNARFPAFIEDTAKAIAWVKKNITQHNGNPNTLFLVGHSAGAHSAAMVATNGRFLASEGLSKQDIQGIAGIAGPYAFIPDWLVTKTVFGPPENYPLLDVNRYVDGNEPDMLLLHSKADKQVSIEKQMTLAATLRANGSTVEEVIYEKLSHIDCVTHLHPLFDSDMVITKDIDRFFKKRLVMTSPPKN